jgi:PAS domain S-box-containing protein
VESNLALQRMLGLSWEEMRLKNFTAFVPAEDASHCLSLFKDLMEGKRGPLQMEKQYLGKDGRQAWGRLTVSPGSGKGGEYQFAIGMLEDITEQKQVEGEIRTYQEQLRSLASELSLTEERERRRLATDLHDHIGQILALAQIKLGAIRELATSSSLTTPMDEIRRLIEQSIQYTRSLTFELSPPILYDLGFEPAVEWLAELIQSQHGMRIEVQRGERQPLPMDDEIRVLLFQTVRELLLNVVKHAQAQRAKVTIGREGNHIRIVVEDDGVGLSILPGAPLSSARGFGLFSIRERLKYLGGHLEVDSEPGRGTRVILTVPVKY